MNCTVYVSSEHLYWTCLKCGYKQLKTMKCYCDEIEELRRKQAANQNIPTKD